MMMKRKSFLKAVLLGLVLFIGIMVIGPWAHWNGWIPSRISEAIYPYYRPIKLAIQGSPDYTEKEIQSRAKTLNDNFPYDTSVTKAFLSRLDEDWENWKQRGVISLAKKITYLVHNYCVNEPPHTEKLVDLFEVCKAACGGYVYVFRNILNVYGVNTRHVALFNIPSQGNHSLVEIEYAPGKWALFDPTFGTFFTKDGLIDGIPVNMDELQFVLFGKDLSRHVFTAKKNGQFDLDAPLENQYLAGEFDKPYMRLQYYHAAEAYGPDGRFRKTTLSLPLRLNGSEIRFGSFYPDPVKSEQEFLKITNETLNDKIDGNDVSFLFSYLGRKNNIREFRNLIDLAGLSVGKTYEIRLSGFNKFNEFKLIPSALQGRAVLSNTQPISLAKGPFNVAFRLRPFSNQVMILLEQYSTSPRFIRLFGVEVVTIEAGD